MGAHSAERTSINNQRGLNQEDKWKTPQIPDVFNSPSTSLPDIELTCDKGHAEKTKDTQTQDQSKQSELNQHGHTEVMDIEKGIDQSGSETTETEEENTEFILAKTIKNGNQQIQDQETGSQS
jgi:hypothetical protein